MAGEALMNINQGVFNLRDVDVYLQIIINFLNETQKEMFTRPYKPSSHYILMRSTEKVNE